MALFRRNALDLRVIPAVEFELNPEQYDKTIVGWWPGTLSRGGLEDISGNGVTGVLNGGPVMVPGPCGPMMSLNGTSQYANAGRILKFETTGYASSLIATFTIDGAAQAGSNPAIVSYGLFGGTSMILDLGFTSSTTKPQFQFKNAGGSYVTLLGTVNLAAGLHTMCCTSDGVNTITLWADGVLITSNAAAGAPFAATSSNVMLIGAENYNTITGRLFRGSLGNVMAFNRALSASDIQRLSTAPVTGLR